MSVRVTDNSLAAEAAVKRTTSIGLREALGDMRKIADPKTPKKTGDLRGSVLMQVLGSTGKISWLKTYAQYQERGYSSGPIVNYTTGGTGAHFAENAAKQVATRGKVYFRRTA